MKICSRCSIEKSLTEFYKEKRTKDGLYPHCKACHKAYCGNWEAQNSDKVRADDARRKRKAYLKDPKKFQDKSRQWRQENPGDHCANTAKYRAAKIQRTPPWLTAEQWLQIKDVYRSRPDDHHVDHIVPLRGTIISGLHVPWNLQHLLAEDNQQKGNRLDGNAYTD